MSLTGSHVTAAKALQLGIVDQVTDQNAVEVAVKFALSIAGEERRREKKERASNWSHGSHFFSRARRGEDGILAGRLFLGLSDIKTR